MATHRRRKTIQCRAFCLSVPVRGVIKSGVRGQGDETDLFGHGNGVKDAGVELAWPISPASRRLDGALYCAVHDIEDLNDLSNADLVDARSRGEILIAQRRATGWAEVPRFTASLGCARSLLPDALSIISRDPRKVCSIALYARALLGAPPPRVSGTTACFRQSRRPA